MVEVRPDGYRWTMLGYTTLYVISVVLDKGEDLLIALKSLKSMLKNMMNGLMQIDLPMSPKSKP